MNVSSRFSFYKGCILGQHILMAYLTDGDSVPPAQLKKQLDIIHRQTQLFVVLITPCISSYNKVRLVAQKVNFVIPNRQMFLPSLLLDIKPDRKVGLDLKETIPPFAQSSLLLKSICTVLLFVPSNLIRSLETSQRIHPTYLLSFKYCIRIIKLLYRRNQQWQCFIPKFPIA